MALKGCQEYAGAFDVDNISNSSSLVLLSQKVWGVGKTHLVCSIAHDVVDKSVGKVGCCPVRFISEQDLLMSIRDTYNAYPHLDNILPAMGYGAQQIKDLEETIRNTDCDLVIAGTPIDLNRVLSSDKPIIRVRYSLDEIGKPDLSDVLSPFLG